MSTLTPIQPGTSAFAAMIDALRAADLLVTDLEEGGARYFSSSSAYGGLAIAGNVALLRSIVVPADARRTGAGQAIVDQILAHARKSGVKDVWLLTTSAESFFAKLGFRKRERSEAPPAIAATSQFKDLCPASAALMHLAFT